MKPGCLTAAMLLLVSAPTAASEPAGAGESGVRYRLSGAAALRPSQIWEDGGRTYIVWPSEAELPAVFSIGSDGREVLADGSMRDGRYVLDRVHGLLVFRIDRSIARAKRTTAR